MSDCFSIEAAQREVWPALLLYHPLSLMLGLSAGPRDPHKKWGVSWCLGAWLQRHLLTQSWVISAPAHPQRGGDDSSQDQARLGQP